MKYPLIFLFLLISARIDIGHCALFTDLEGKLRIVFHAHNSTTKIHPRNMYISTVNFKIKDGKEIMVIDKNNTTAIFKKQ